MFRKIICMTFALLLSLPLLATAGTVQLPQTGQTTCYDSLGGVIDCPGTGQDGDLRAGVTWPNPRFTVSGDCVTDSLTGLMWARNGNLAGGTRTWQGALDYAAALDSGGGLCGYSDWRLPNVNELESLVNAEQANSAIWLNDQGFTNVQANWYWSSSSNASYTTLAWTVYMRYGYVDSLNKSDYSYYVWPVRAGQ